MRFLEPLSVLRRLGGRLELGHERRGVEFTEAASIADWNYRLEIRVRWTHFELSTNARQLLAKHRIEDTSAADVRLH